MKKSIFRQTPQIKLYFMVLIGLTLFSCEPEALNSKEDIQVFDLNTEKAGKAKELNEFYGPSQPMGKGIVRSFVSINKNGVPVSVGIVFSEKILENLPEEETNITLKLHKKAENLIVDHIDFGFNPQGHPGQVFMVEHFDIHFYWISPEEKAEIPFLIGLGDLPPSTMWPDAYAYDVATIPQMGRHWILESQNNSTEFNQTFVYGSWDFKFTFYEPMITVEYLKEKEFEDSYNITPLGEYLDAGYYADSYKIQYDHIKKQYRVLLTDLFMAGGAL
ncbi:DUF5602 domain-containing protein [Gramella sp. AN32]|uniref:DUF5602 domain-containing protein n=1 Tax=Christiangramia antarctica TaxID=2058158 RepID=A0ABW5X099_9FLAO|nr:DUF5602 domain-containing protein [Gramella sp. AN32]MCM4154863.1 hypothetical protein [Gramella sp. AN32]